MKLSWKDIAGCFNAKENFKSLMKRKQESYVPVIDSFRVLSFLWVFGFHTLYILRFFLPKESLDQFYQETGFLIFLWRGSLGVDAFFVISGLLITMILMDEYEKTGKIKIGKFYKRRFLRLMPIYYLALLVILIGYPPEYEAFQAHNASSAWSNFLYVNNFIANKDQFMLWSWSLAVEEQYYLIYPLVFAFLIKYPRFFTISIMGGFILSMIFRWNLSSNLLFQDPSFVKLVDVHTQLFDTIYDKLHMRMGSILCGVFAAICFYKSHSILNGLKKWGMPFTALLELILIAGLVFLVVYENFDGLMGKLYLSQFRNLFSLLFTGLVLLYLFTDSKQTIFKGLLSSRFWYPLAHLSYTNYIWHPMVLFTFYFLIWRIDEHLNTTDIVIVVVVSYVVTMILSVLSFVFVEKPFMRMREFV